MREQQSFTFTTVLGDVEIGFTNPAQLNQMWGSIASQLGGAGIMGQHTNANAQFISQPRDGVGNVSNDDPRFDNPMFESQNNLSDGGNGLHAVFQAARLGSPALPPGSVEASVGPFFPDAHGQVTFTPLFDL